MIRTIQQGERIAEKNAAETQIRRNSSPPRKRKQALLYKELRSLRIAAENPAQTQMHPNHDPIPYMKANPPHDATLP